MRLWFNIGSFAILFFGDAAIPNPRGHEDGAATGAEPDQKRNGQIKMRADRTRRRKSAAEIRIKRAGPRALPALLQDQLHGLVVARERRRAGIRTNHALRCRRFDAIGAHCPSAISADGDGFGMVS